MLSTEHSEAMDKEQVIEQIRQAFASNLYPGDSFLQGSHEGSEPYEEVGAFVGKTDWSAIDSAALDRHYSALSFFSEGGFRYFLPAFLIADLREQLASADPLFHLCHGFVIVSADVPVGGHTFRRASGGSTLLNPKRYGSMTWSDYARYRLSIFTREEARAIVAYMNYKHESDPSGLSKSEIETAIKEFWFDRAENAPSREQLEAHLKEDEKFGAALRRERE
jgi:hypothetical protein